MSEASNTPVRESGRGAYDTTDVPARVLTTTPVPLAGPTSSRTMSEASNTPVRESGPV